jgi:hypothetical protein
MKDDLTGLDDSKMTKLDWVKAIVGALIAVPVMYAMMVIIMVL